MAAISGNRMTTCCPAGTARELIISNSRYAPAQLVPAFSSTTTQSMATNMNVGEDAYDADDGYAAYEGLDAYVGDEGSGNHDTIYGIRVDADSDDDDYEEEEQEDEDDEEFDQEINDDYFIDDGADEPEGLDTIYIDASQSTSSRFETILQSTTEHFVTSHWNVLNESSDVIAAQVDASSVGADSDGAATNALNRILAVFQTRSVTGGGVNRIHNIRSRSDASEQSSETGGDSGPTNHAQRRKWIESWWKKPHSEPQPAGVALLTGGEFGRVGRRSYIEPDETRNFSRVLIERSKSIHPISRQDLCEAWSYLRFQNRLLTRQFLNSLWCRTLPAPR